LGVATSRFWTGGRGVAGGGRETLLDYILSCSGRMFESGYFSSKI